MVPEHVSRLLTEYVDGELRPRQRRSVERLLQQSPDARALLEGLQKDAADIGDLPQATTERDFSRDVLRKIGRAAAVPALLPYTIRRPAAAWFRHATAASVLVGASLGTLIYILTRSTPSPHPQIAEVPLLYLPEFDAAKVVVNGKETPSFAGPLSERPFLGALPPPLPPRSIPRLEPIQDSSILGVEPIWTESLKSLSLGVPFFLKLQEINSKQEKLQGELTRDISCRVDVFESELLPALRELRSGLKTVGVDLLDKNARDQLGLGLEFKSHVAIFLESTNPKELTAILSRLGGVSPKGNVAVSRLTTNEQGKLADPFEVQADQPQPVKALRLKEEIAALRSSSGSSASKTAVAVAFDPSRLHEFLLPTQVPVLRPGDVRALIILHARQ
jgi:hypothetical protein